MSRGYHVGCHRRPFHVFGSTDVIVGRHRDTASSVLGNFRDFSHKIVKNVNFVLPIGSMGLSFAVHRDTATSVLE
jgi:hypothetical protein